MSGCEHIMFSDENLVEISDLESNVEPVTDLDWLKNEHRSRQTKWNEFSEECIYIDGYMADLRLASFLAIPGHNLLPTAEVRLYLWNDEVSTDPVYDSGPTLIGNILPLGIWSAGVDPYGAANNESLDDVIALWLDEPVLTNHWRVEIKHKHGYVEPTDPPPVIVSDGIYQQDPTTGVLSIEAENGVVETEGGLFTWELDNLAGASGGVNLFKGGYGYHHTHNDGPKVKFEFTATQSGTFNVWLRLLSNGGGPGVQDDGGYSIFTVFNGDSTTKYFQSILNNGWQWRDTKQITLSAGQKYTLYVAHRHRQLAFDKLVILPSTEASPTGIGPAESGFGTKTEDGTPGAITSTTSMNLRMLMLGDVIQLEKNFSYGSDISFLTEPDLHFAHSGFAITSRAQQHAKALSLSLDSMTEGDRFTMRNYETKLAGKPFLVSPYPSGTAQWFRGDYVFLARFANSLKYKHLTPSNHRTSLNLVEV